MKKTEKDTELRRKTRMQMTVNATQQLEENEPDFNPSDIEVINPEDLFGDTGTDSQMNPSKELFNPKNPKIKSELSNEEILLMSRLYNLSKKYYEPKGTFMLRDCLNEMIILRISKDRGSRKEFVETNREAMKNKADGFLNRIMGQGGTM